MASIALSGQVLVKESQRGVAGLVVVATAPTPVGRLGSAVTDASGRFAIEATLPSGYERAEVTLSVLPPEGATPSTPLAFAAPRMAGGGPEAFVLWIPDAALDAAGVERPRPGPAAAPDADLLTARAAVDVAQRTQLAAALVSTYAPAVAAQRDRARIAADNIQFRLHNDLGMNRAGRPRVVAPGATVDAVIATAVGDALANVAASGPSHLRLSITAAQLDGLRNAPGSTMLDRNKVEAVAFAGGARARTREDAMARWCAQLTRPLPQLTVPTTPPPVTPPPVAPIDLDATLVKIVDEIANRSAPVVAARGDDASVRGRLRALDLTGGPADRVAFFDYGTLVGTIDGVWQELLDRDLVANAAELLESLGDAGGVMTGGQPVFHQLAREAAAVHLAALGGPRLRTREQPSGVSYRLPVVGTIRGLLDFLVGSGGNDDREPVRDHQNGAPDGVPPQMPPPRPAEARTPDYEALLAELNERLTEPYSFQVFAADGDQRAIDFGLFVTYRQTWDPQGHQAGALVKTTTLAPREERAYTTRTTYKRSTTAVRATNVENQRKSESQETTRAASDIVHAAKSSLGFESTHSGGIEVGELISAESSLTVTGNRERSSQETRQSLREAVRRSAQEAKESLRAEVTTSESTESFNEETGKISNPNDELPVTYLFYELQRRFRVSERVHQVVPVVMVARAVPSPERITRGWLFTHGWILQRALLDEQFHAPLRYLLQDAAGMEAKAAELKVERDIRRELVGQLKQEVLALGSQVEAAYRVLQHASQGGLAVLLGRTEETLKKAYDLAVQRDSVARDRLAEAVAAQEVASRAYTEALAEFRDRELSVRRLRIHVKQHILHYMRAIWNVEDRDQRFFELHSVRVPRLAGHLDYELVPDPDAPPVPPLWQPPYKIKATLVSDTPNPMNDTVPLAQVADLERPLGYKGNFMVFPLRQHNVLTKFLSLPYLDNRMGACDPELLANFTLSELDEYVACARAALQPAQFAALLPQIQTLYQALLDRPFPDEEEIVVPTSSTFIEALPGTRPVLEDYKLLHRVIDVAKAAADVRARELENLRLVARIRDGQLSDPDIQTMVVAPADAGVTVATPPGGNG